MERILEFMNNAFFISDGRQLCLLKAKTGTHGEERKYGREGNL
jgi:hypothetical protein